MKPISKHGLTAYVKHGCRCDQCKAAMSASLIRQKELHADRRFIAICEVCGVGRTLKTKARSTMCASCSLRRPITAEMLATRYEVKENGCWSWTGPMYPNGYGLVSDHGRGVGAHRYSYEMLVGPIPAGLHVDHLCRNRACVNPDHLEPVTPGENVLRGVGISAVNALKTHCIRGHEFNAANTYMTPKGRHCKACQAERKRGYRARRVRERQAAILGLNAAA